MAATFQSILHDLHNGKYASLYLLEGDEPFFIDQIVDYIEEHALDEAGKAFDLVVMYGSDTNDLGIVEEAKRFPMIGSRRVIIVKEAQQLKKFDALLAYAKNPVLENIVVIAHKNKRIDGRLPFPKYIKQHFVYLESKKLYDNQIAGWVENHLKTQGLHIDPKAAALLAEFVGTDLSRLNNELEKLSLVIPKSSNITALDIEQNIGISKDYNNFELVAALAHKDILKANSIIKYFSQNPKNNPLPLTTGILYNYFSRLLITHVAKDKSPAGLARELKVNPFFVKDYLTGARNYTLNKTVKIIGYIREMDTRSKGINNVSTSDYDLLRECIFKILH